MRSTAAALAVALIAAAACSATPDDSPGSAFQTPSAQSVLAAPAPARQFGANGILPAFETAAERATRGKFDSNDDFRIKNAAWYAQTRPPAAGQFRPFGEWEPMAAVWTTYSNGMVSTKAVRRMYAEQTIAFVRHSKPAVLAKVIVAGDYAGADFLKALDQYGITAAEKKLVQLVTLPHDTIWLIDYSGFPLIHKTKGTIAFADWVYYKPRVLDDAVPTRLANSFYKATVYRTPFPFEGGNIQADGVGMCATTVRALQNTGYSALKVRNVLKSYAACDKTLIVKDITDDGTGHIDMFFKWVDTDTVLLGRYEDSITLDYNGDGQVETLPMPGKVAADYSKTFALNKQRMDDDAALFGCIKSAKGTPFKVHRLAMMTRFKDDYGDLPRTFINSTFTNGVNVYPSYTTSSCRNPQGKVCMQDSQCAAGQHCAAARCTTGPVARGCDELVGCDAGESCTVDPLKVALTKLAQSQWQKAMPKWKHVGLRADTIGLWSGAIHCITRTIPVGPVNKVIADGTCAGGKCGGVSGGTVQACSASAQCSGPKWDCDCNICMGKCANGKACGDDADCSTDGSTVAKGSCVVNPSQQCYVGSVTSNSCAGKCGGYSEGAPCQCDVDCGKYNDCCGDYAELCDTGSSGLQVQCDPDGGATPDAGASDAGCQPQCQGKVCGPNGCGGSCGDCQAGSKCDAGACVGSVVDAGKPPTDSGATLDAGCQPQCQGKVCGANGCGGSCGQCGGGASCDGAGQCVGAPPVDAGQGDGGACLPMCGGKTCGDDGCGGTCGVCIGGQTCSAAGQCAGPGVDAASQPDLPGQPELPQADGGSGGTDGPTPIGSDSTAGQPTAMTYMAGSSSGCSAGGSRGSGGLLLVLCLLALAWRRRPISTDVR